MKIGDLVTDHEQDIGVVIGFGEHDDAIVFYVTIQEWVRTEGGTPGVHHIKRRHLRKIYDENR